MARILSLTLLVRNQALMARGPALIALVGDLTSMALSVVVVEASVLVMIMVTVMALLALAKVKALVVRLAKVTASATLPVQAKALEALTRLVKVRVQAPAVVLVKAKALAAVQVRVKTLAAPRVKEQVSAVLPVTTTTGATEAGVQDVITAIVQGLQDGMSQRPDSVIGTLPSQHSAVGMAPRRSMARRAGMVLLRGQCVVIERGHWTSH